MRRKVIFCTDGVFPNEIGGMQRHSRLLIEELAKHNSLELVVIHPHSEQVFDKSLGIEEIPVQGINIHRNYLMECYRYSKRVYAIVSAYPEAVIYSQGLSIWYKCSQLTSRLIVNPHGLEPYQGITRKDKLIGTPFRIIFNHIFSNSRYVISLGGKLTDILKSNIKDISKIITIPNAVNTPTTTDITKKPAQPGTIQALFVSRFAHNKGIGVLMDAITKLNKEGCKDKFRFKLVGKGPLFDYYTTKFKFSNVEYLGFVDDEALEKLYAEADVFVFPTLFEGMPTVVLEAMAKGLPIIVSDTGATAELVDESNGFLITKNNVALLTDSLISFSELPLEERRKMALASIGRVQDRFTWERVAKNHLELFDTLN